MSSPAASAYTSLSLKFVGVILVVSSLLDYLILIIPPNLLERQWQIGVTTQLVDRGIIPMVGIAFLLAGYWIEGTMSKKGSDLSSSWLDLRFWALLLASVLGAMFLVLVPLHLNNVRLASAEQFNQIEERASQAENQIQNQSEQFNQLLADEEQRKQIDAQIQQLDQVISSGQLQGQQLNERQLNQAQARRDFLKAIQENPEAVEERITAAETQLSEKKDELETRAKTTAWKSSFKTGVSSLLLAIGYIAISWTGLKSYK